MTGSSRALPVEPAPTAPTVPEDLEAGHAGLFGAYVAGAFDPAPVVTIAGVDVAGGPAADGSLPGRLVVDGLSVTWGRDDVMTQPDPATGRLTIFDPAGTWATSLDLRGQLILLSWTGTVPGTGPVRQTFFRGRVGSPVKVRRKTVVAPSGEVVHGSLVELPLVSILVDLANVTPLEAWPAETMEARRARIAAAAAGVLTGVTLRDYWKSPGAAPVAVADQVSLYEHLVNLYDSAGADRMTYRPHSNDVTYVARRDYWTSRGHGALWWDVTADGTPRSNQGVYARATGNNATFGYLDATHLEYDPADGITQPPRLTSVRLTHRDSGTAFADRTITRAVDGTDPVRDGIRMVSLDSIVTWNNYADVALNDLEDLAQKEAAAWRLEPLIWRTRLSGGFHDYTQALRLLGGYEVEPLMFLQRSWLPVYGLRPVFGVMGQTITYRDRGWELAIELAPITTTLAQHAITFEEMDDGSADYQIQWWDGDHPRGMHESLTFEDLGWVARGLGPAGPVPPDQGWDQIA